MKLSVVVPCYNEQEMVFLFSEKTINVIHQMDCEYEVLFVDDGSSDDTLTRIASIAKENEHIKYISFSRNFGKEAAIYAGLCNVSGDFIVIMDADLQDPPELLSEMLAKLDSGEYDAVATRRVDRKGEPPVRSFFARRFYSLINKISDADIVDGARDFRMMRREVVDAILAMPEYNRFSKGIFGWIGFRTYWLPYENVERMAGETKWSFWGLCKYALDGIISFSQAPLLIASWLGMFMTVMSFFALVFIIIRRMVFGDPVSGWASTICVIVFIGGVQMFCLGIIGQYLAKTYMETKRRPHYIVAKSNVEKIGRVG